MDVLLFGGSDEYILLIKKVLNKSNNVDIFFDLSKCVVHLEENFSEKRMYDMIIIDLDETESGGITLLQRIRSLEESFEKKNSKILLLSKYLDKSKVLNFFSVKEDMFLKKPESEEEFFKILKEVGF